MPSDTRILIIGAGAVGGITAALMKQHGYDVTLVCKYPDLAERITHKGLHLFGYCGDQRIRIPSVATTGEVEGEMDVVFIATKATEMNQAAHASIPLLKSSSRVVSMQNGIVEEELAKIVGPDRAVGCVVSFGATMHEPGVLEMTSRGDMVVGYLDRGPDGVLEEISEMLSSVVPARTTDRIMSHLYSKLIINSCTSTLGAISGLDLGPLLKRKKARHLFIAIAREAVAVADAMRLHLVPYAGKVRYYSLLKQPPFWQHLFIRLFGWKYKKLRSTNLRSLERGNKTEIDFLNGYIVGKGEQLGVDTPVNRRLAQMVHEIEIKRRPISPVNLEDELLDEHL
ncbi:MAG: ketopantoate reductase family protein [Bacteroidales bacterium]|nr:ketopantoate reductase family protein [Bacteroidales bacterium]